MSRIRVVIDTISLVRASTGIRTYTIELCKAAEEQSESGEIEYLIYPSWKKVDKFFFFGGDQHFFKRMLHHIFYFFWKQLILPIFCVLKKADALICPDYVLPLWKLNLLKIGVVHSPFFWEYPQHYNSIWLRYYVKMINAGFGGDSIISTTSEYTKQAISNYLKPKSPIEVVYQSPKHIQGISHEQIHDYLDLLHEKFILHVGYFDKRKNLSTLIKAFSEMLMNDSSLNIKLVLAGGRATGSSDDYDNVVKLVESLGLKSKVILTGYVSELELEFLYRRSLLYVFPSFNEGFGIPVLEAMGMGVPVIVSDSGSLREIGGDAVEVFSTFDERELSQKMAKLIKEDTQRKFLIEKGFERHRMFSRRDFLRQYEKLIISRIKD